MTKDEALRMALEALKKFHYSMIDAGVLDRQEVLNEGFTAATAIKEALALPQRTWVGLTDEEVDECYYWKDRQWTTDELVRHVEAKLKEKNT